MDASWDGRMYIPVLGHCDLDLVSRIIVSVALLLYIYMRQEYQIWCVHASWNCDITLHFLFFFETLPVWYKLSLKNVFE